MNAIDVQTKRLKVYDDNTLLYSMKILIKNSSKSEEIHCEIQGIDQDGFEICSVEFSGIIPIGESKYLTTTSSGVDKDLFETINKWQVK